MNNYRKYGRKIGLQIKKGRQTMTVYDLPHIAEITEIANSGNYKVKTEEGYWIRKPDMPENVWKTVTFIYPADDLTAIQIVATADLPEGAEMCGGEENEPEIM